jgi:hypothetical protein
MNADKNKDLVREKRQRREKGIYLLTRHAGVILASIHGSDP